MQGTWVAMLLIRVSISLSFVKIAWQRIWQPYSKFLKVRGCVIYWIGHKREENMLIGRWFAYRFTEAGGTHPILLIFCVLNSRPHWLISSWLIIPIFLRDKVSLFHLSETIVHYFALVAMLNFNLQSSIARPSRGTCTINFSILHRKWKNRILTS